MTVDPCQLLPLEAFAGHLFGLDKNFLLCICDLLPLLYVDSCIFLPFPFLGADRFLGHLNELLRVNMKRVRWIQLDLHWKLFIDKRV